MKWRWRPEQGDWSEKIVGPKRYDSHDTEFYAHALALAVSVRRPFILVYHTAIAALVMLAIVIVIWAGFQIAGRSMPVRDVTATLMTSVAPAGGRVRVAYAFNRVQVCAVDISASVIDGQGDLKPLVTLHREVGGPLGRDRFVRSFQVPDDAAPGLSRLRVAWAYVCPGNYSETLSPIALAFPDLPFMIDSR